MKIGTHEISKKVMIIGGVILVGVFIFIFLSIPSCQKPPDTTAAIAAIKAELESKYKANIDKQTKLLEAKDKTIEGKDRLIKQKEEINSSIRIKLAESDLRYKSLSKDYEKLKGEIGNVTLPTTDKEMRSRYTAAGFPPAALGVCGPGYVCFSTGYK